VHAIHANFSNFQDTIWLTKAKKTVSSTVGHDLMHPTFAEGDLLARR
jgi:hypothetical protein